MRNLFVLDEHRVAVQIGPGFGGVGLRLGQARCGRFAIALGHFNRGLRVGDIRFGAGDIGAAFGLGDGNVGLLRCHLTAGLRHLRARLIHRHLEIARIQIHQRIARFHELVLIDINMRNGAVDTRADGIQVSFHLGVVRGFEVPRLEPKVNADPGRDQQDQEENEERAATAASGWLFRLLVPGLGRGRRCGRCVGGGAHGLTPD